MENMKATIVGDVLKGGDGKCYIMPPQKLPAPPKEFGINIDDLDTSVEM